MDLFNSYWKDVQICLILFFLNIKNKNKQNNKNKEEKKLNKFILLNNN